jgi:probable O-glycosylation ligase (exosortase A-associated)
MLLAFMPDTWFARMQTIENYQEDASAMGRINAWGFAYNLANDRFLGGGLGVFQPEFFAKWAPVPENVHDAHSIYFEVLGEQGWVGLAIFLMLLWFTWRTCSRIIKDSSGKESLSWANGLAKMIQVSLIAYITGGAFLGLAYWDLPYTLMAIAVLLRREVKEALHEPLARPAARRGMRTRMTSPALPHAGPR